MRPPLAAATVALLLLSAGCLGGSGTDRAPSDQRALDALDRARAAMDDVRTYRTSIDGRVEASTDDEQVTFGLDGEVRVNATARRMNATASLVGLPTSGFSEGQSTTYVDNYTAHIECSRIGWERQNLSQSEPWLTYTPIGQHLELLNRTNVYWRGTETVDGRNASVVVGYPTKADLEAVDVRSVGMTEQMASSNLENVTVTIWLDAATDRPIQVRRDIRGTQDGVSAHANGTFLFQDFDEPTHLTEPEFGDVIWEGGCPG